MIYIVMVTMQVGSYFPNITNKVKKIMCGACVSHTAAFVDKLGLLAFVLLVHSCILVKLMTKVGGEDLINQVAEDYCLIIPTHCE